MTNDPREGHDDLVIRAFVLPSSFTLSHSSFSVLILSSQLPGVQITGFLPPAGASPPLEPSGVQSLPG